MFDAAVRRRLADLRAASLLRESRVAAPVDGATAEIDGRSVILLCSNDYLGHGRHPDLVRAVEEGARRWGSGAGASRLISGSQPPHRLAERATAELVGAPAAVLFSSGYAANVGAVQATVGPGDLVLSDALNHASLIDGCRLSRATVRVYPHRDLEQLEALLRSHRAHHRDALVVTDALFSMDGDLAPLRALRDLCDRYQAGLLVDEAHALGVLGPEGRGACAAAGIRADVVVGTLGKALGLGGAFVAGSEDLALLVENRARSYVVSTAVPPAVAAAIPTAVSLARAAGPARATLQANAIRLRDALRAQGHAVAPGESAIIPVLLGDPVTTMRASARLLELGVFAHGIRPPTVPAGTSRLRVVATAAHAPHHLDRALEAFAILAHELR